MIDFHSHILPCLDDGSKSVDESIKMLKTLASQGVKKVVATPHFYANDESIEQFLNRRDEAFLKIKNDGNLGVNQVDLGGIIAFLSAHSINSFNLALYVSIKTSSSSAN